LNSTARGFAEAGNLGGNGVRNQSRTFAAGLVLGLAWIVGASCLWAADAASGIQWLTYQEGLAHAEKSGKQILVFFTADWCKYCQVMKKETYSDPEVIAYVNEHFVPVMVDTQKERKLTADYYVRGLPTTWFLTSDGERLSNLPSYVEAPLFLKVLEYLATGSYEKMDFKTYLDTTSAES
jgi:thioredoxin-related protein